MTKYQISLSGVQEILLSCLTPGVGVWGLAFSVVMKIMLKIHRGSALPTKMRFSYNENKIVKSCDTRHIGRYAFHYNYQW